LREINAENLCKNINNKGFKERVRTLTTSSTPLALVKIRLFLVSRTLWDIGRNVKSKNKRKVKSK
jgi:hypothetical protein